MTAIDAAARSDVAAAYARCEEITKTEARNFSYGIRLLPPIKRAALSAVYAFSRRIDDIGDESGPAAKKLAELARARADLDHVGLDSPDPVLVALADSARRLPIRLEVFGELIDGVEADVRGVRYETFDNLVGYCRQVAGSIGRLSLGVYGGPDTPLARSRADALGVALQLTNILRDVREDLGNGRIYLPAADLRRHGVVLRLADNDADNDAGTEADRQIAGPRLPLVQMMRAEAAIARAWYTEGLKLLPMLDARSAACTAAMAGIYSRLLRRVAERPDLALTRRTSLPTAEKAAVALTSLTAAALRAGRS